MAEPRPRSPLPPNFLSLSSRPTALRLGQLALHSPPHTVVSENCRIADPIVAEPDPPSPAIDARSGVDRSPPTKPRHCGYCHRQIPMGTHPYTMRVEFFPRVADSLDITPGDFEIDFDAELKDIVAQLEAMSEEEIRLQEERLYTRFCFILCPACRDRLVQGFSDSSHVPEP